MIDYCTTQELKDYLRISDDQDDTVLALAITAASRAIDKATNRNFSTQLTTAELRYFEPDASGVEIDDLFTSDGLVVSGSEDYHLAPRNAPSSDRPWTKIVGRFTDTVEVTAKWGWPSVPTPIKQATLLQASRFVVRRDSPFGVAGSPEAGTEIRLLAKIDPDVDVIVGPYRRWWGAAGSSTNNYGCWSHSYTSVWG